MDAKIKIVALAIASVMLAVPALAQPAPTKAAPAVYNPLDFAPAGVGFDTVQIPGATVKNGSSALAVTKNTFVPADRGKALKVFTAPVHGRTVFAGCVYAYNSASSITLGSFTAAGKCSGPATYSGPNLTGTAVVRYGTDVGPAINAAIAANGDASQLRAVAVALPMKGFAMVGKPIVALNKSLQLSCVGWNNARDSKPACGLEWAGAAGADMITLTCSTQSRIRGMMLIGSSYPASRPRALIALFQNGRPCLAPTSFNVIEGNLIGSGAGYGLPEDGYAPAQFGIYAGGPAQTDRNIVKRNYFSMLNEGIYFSQSQAVEWTLERNSFWRCGVDVDNLAPDGTAQVYVHGMEDLDGGMVFATGGRLYVSNLANETDNATAVGGVWLARRNVVPNFVVRDNNGNFQRVVEGQRTGAGQPAWAVNALATTQDGGVRWSNIGQYVVVVRAGEGGGNFSLRVNGYAVALSSSGGAARQIAAGLADAIDSDRRINRDVSAAVDLANRVVIAARSPKPLTVAAGANLRVHSAMIATLMGAANFGGSPIGPISIDESEYEATAFMPVNRVDGTRGDIIRLDLGDHAQILARSLQLMTTGVSGAKPYLTPTVDLSQNGSAYRLFRCEGCLGLNPKQNIALFNAPSDTRQTTQISFIPGPGPTANNGQNNATLPDSYMYLVGGWAGRDWRAQTAYNSASVITPWSRNPWGYSFEGIGNGRSGTTPPDWASVPVNATVRDGSQTWKNVGFVRAPDNYLHLFPGKLVVNGGPVLINPLSAPTIVLLGGYCSGGRGYTYHYFVTPISRGVEGPHSNELTAACGRVGAGSTIKFLILPSATGAEDSYNIYRTAANGAPGSEHLLPVQMIAGHTGTATIGSNSFLDDIPDRAISSIPIPQHDQGTGALTVAGMVTMGNLPIASFPPCAAGNNFAQLWATGCKTACIAHGICLPGGPHICRMVCKGTASLWEEDGFEL